MLAVIVVAVLGFPQGLSEGALEEGKPLVVASGDVNSFQVDVSSRCQCFPTDTEVAIGISPNSARSAEDAPWNKILNLSTTFPAVDVPDKEGRRWMVQPASYRGGAWNAGYRFRAEVPRRQLRSGLAAGEKRIDPASGKPGARWLASTPSCDYGSASVKSWILKEDVTRGKGDAAARFALRVLSRIRTLRYEDSADNPGSASEVAAVGGGKCAGLVNLYCAVLRAGRVAARQAVGLLVFPGDTTRASLHAIAEFYDPRAGWIPVEVAGAVDEPSKSVFEFFGVEEGWFIPLYYGSDVVIDDGLRFGQGPDSYVFSEGEVGGMATVRFGPRLRPSETRLSITITKIPDSHAKESKTAGPMHRYIEGHRAQPMNERRPLAGCVGSGVGFTGR